MPTPRLIPDRTELRRLVASGKTHAQIADLVYERTGHRVTRGAVSAAISRANLSSPANRYKDHLPWKVRVEHSKHYAARMLRLLGRRDGGEQLAEGDEARLNAWLDKVNEENVVVAYASGTDEGFFYVPKPRGHRGKVPIIEQEVKVS